MKIKPRTKKIVVLSVMVALLVATGVLNWALNDRLTTGEPIDAGVVTETFFAAYRSDGAREYGNYKFCAALRKDTFAVLPLFELHQKGELSAPPLRYGKAATFERTPVAVKRVIYDKPFGGAHKFAFRAEAGIFAARARIYIYVYFHPDVAAHGA